MSKKIQLEITDPCHENWAKMTKSEQGRFCASCQKQVVDFTMMTDRDIALFFKKPSTGSVCGRFMNDQLNREMEIPKKRIPWVKYFFQFTLPAFLLSMKATAQGRVKVKQKKADTAVVAPAPRLDVVGTVAEIIEVPPTLMGDTTAIPVRPKLSIKEAFEKIEMKITLAELPVDTTLFSGVTYGLTVSTPVEPTVCIPVKIVNENDEPVPFATVFLAGVGATVKAQVADEEGRINIQAGKKWKKAEIIISSAGFHERKIEITRRELPEEQLIVRLQPKALLPEVVVTSQGTMGVIKRSVVMGGVSGGINIDTTKVVEVPVIKTITSVPVLRVYPNPVLAGSTINIACEKLDEGYYSFQLLNFSGQVIHQREVWVDEKATVLNFEVPRAAAGSYVLRMIHKQSGKTFTEKVILQ